MLERCCEHSLNKNFRLSALVLSLCTWRSMRSFLCDCCTQIVLNMPQCTERSFSFVAGITNTTCVRRFTWESKAAVQEKEKGDTIWYQKWKELGEYPLMYDPDNVLQEFELGFSGPPCQNHLHKNHRLHQDQNLSLPACTLWIRAIPIDSVKPIVDATN